MTFPLPIPPAVREMAPPGTGVLVAVSGGVDSSVALALLGHLGCEVYAVTFKNFCYADQSTPSPKACCSLEAIDDARRVAQKFGVRHWVTDVTDLFRQQVIEPFVQEYSVARTPNPCLVCNARVRFPEMARLADQLGLPLLASGHYARITSDGDRFLLRRAVDEEKDQAYFLYGVERELLRRIVFPLGWYRKEQVRRAAKELGLPVADKPESQEICFVPDGDRSFLFDATAASESGEIVDRTGKVLGRHVGLAHYTVGQRRGLGIAAPEPLYVLALDGPGNRLVVGRRSELDVQRLVCDQFVATVPGFPETGPAASDRDRWLARIRYRHRGAPVRSWLLQGDMLTIDLAEPVQGAAPGQALVLYRDDIVSGGGRIVATEPATEPDPR